MERWTRLPLLKNNRELPKLARLLRHAFEAGACSAQSVTDYPTWAAAKKGFREERATFVKEIVNVYVNVHEG